MDEEFEVTPEEAERVIEDLAGIVHRRQMHTPAVLFLESTKALSHLGGEFLHIFVIPFIPVWSEEWGSKSAKYVTVLQSRKNVEKLIKRIEGLYGEKPTELSAPPK